MAFSADGFDGAVALPPGLTVAHLLNAIDFVEEQAEDLIDLYFEQANIFSGIIGIMGVRALDSFSPYKRHKHPDVAQEHFPDLSLRGRLNPLHGKPWNRRAAYARGRFSRTITIPAGTLCGAMLLIQQSG